ncbi:MAG: trimethylamine methyltransferase family protein [Bacillota bacterium]|nr:trimethylamine methyltransferase family protein [Bacillota bacterium]
MDKIKPKLELLTEAEIEKIHQCSLNILEQVGVIFKEAQALELFRHHGIRVEGETVYLSAAAVEKALATIPQSFTLRGRDPGKSVVIGAGEPVLAPGSGAVFIQDTAEGRRKGTRADYIKLVKLVHTSPLLQVNGGGLVTVSDVEERLQHVFMLLTLLKYTDKPLLGFTLGREAARDSIYLAQLAFGEKSENIILGVANAVTPLLYDATMIEGIREFVLNNQPICIASCSMAGSTSPVTLAGSLACVNAELLAGMVFTQLLKPGAPVIYGNTSAITDMKTMTLAIGAVETAMINLAASQLAKYYHIPFRSGGSLSDAKEVDVQAGYESMLNLATSVFDGASFVLQATGILESFMTLSYDKFIIDEEIGMMLRRYGKGFQLGEEDLAFELIKERGAGGHFLDAEHTMHHFRREFFDPQVSNRQPYEIWRRNPITAVNKAGEIWRKRLTDYEAPRLDKGCQEAINKYIEQKYGRLTIDALC